MTADQYDAILERLYKEGFHPDPGEPEVLEIHNINRRNSQSLKKLNVTNISFVEFNPCDCFMEYGHQVVELI